MKNFLKTAAILAFFYWIGVATSKSQNFPCDYQIQNFLSNDTAIRAYYSFSTHDTIIVTAYKDSLWESKTSAICKLLKDSCKISGYKIMVLDTTYNHANWNTPYGKQLYFRQCP